jgi:hypothetical protein
VDGGTGNKGTREQGTGIREQGLALPGIAEEEEAAGSDGVGAGAGEIGRGGDAAEEHEEVPEGAEEVFSGFLGHGEKSFDTFILLDIRRGGVVAEQFRDSRRGSLFEAEASTHF